jgi:hypothetical protein
VTHSGGEASLTPTGPGVPLSDPLRTPEELALLLATHGYRLPEDLEALVAGVYKRYAKKLQAPDGGVA